MLGLKVWEAPAREVWARMEGKSQRMLAAAAWPEKCDSHRGDDAVRQVRQFDSVAAAVNRTAVGSSGV